MSGPQTRNMLQIGIDLDLLIGLDRSAGIRECSDYQGCSNLWFDWRWTVAATAITSRPDTSQVPPFRRAPPNLELRQ